MKIRQIYQIIIIQIALIISCLAILVDPNDILQGNGLFLTSSINEFQLDSSHTTDLINWTGINVLKLVKPKGQNISYTEGLSYVFGPVNPKHVQFKFASVNPNIQDTNLRIFNSNDQTLILFRAGRGGLIRVNEKQMIGFYNDTISTDSDIKLTQMDLILHWESQTIEIFVNSTYRDTCHFFEENIESVDQLLLYNLYNSTSYWGDLVICQQICYDFNWENGLLLGGFSMIVFFFYF